MKFDRYFYPVIVVSDDPEDQYKCDIWFSNEKVHDITELGRKVYNFMYKQVREWEERNKRFPPLDKEKLAKAAKEFRENLENGSVCWDG